MNSNSYIICISPRIWFCLRGIKSSSLPLGLHTAKTLFGTCFIALCLPDSHSSTLPNGTEAVLLAQKVLASSTVCQPLSSPKAGLASNGSLGLPWWEGKGHLEEMPTITRLLWVWRLTFSIPMLQAAPGFYTASTPSSHSGLHSFCVNIHHDVK